MARKATPTITYPYRGSLERYSMRSGASWVRGYSETTTEGGILYPWMTKRQCQSEARRRGAKAVFKEA